MRGLSCGRVGSGCPLTRVTRHPLAEPDLRVSRYPALPLRFAEDILYQGAGLQRISVFLCRAAISCCHRSFP